MCPVPEVLQACRDAREEGLKAYTIAFGQVYNGNNDVLVIPQIDSIFFHFPAWADERGLNRNNNPLDLFKKEPITQNTTVSIPASPWTESTHLATPSLIFHWCPAPNHSMRIEHVMVIQPRPLASDEKDAGLRLSDALRKPGTTVAHMQSVPEYQFFYGWNQFWQELLVKIEGLKEQKPRQVDHE